MDIILSFAALLLLCLFFTHLNGQNSALAPLLALCCIMLWLTAFGMAGLLLVGGWLLYAACLLLGGWALWRGRLPLLKRLRTPGFLLFVCLAVVLAIRFAVARPMLSGWDEYNFWGLAPKIVVESNRMYPVSENGFWWTMTESPGMVMLSYFVQFFGAFAPWKVYWSYGLLTLACVAALLAPFAARRWRIWVPLAVCGLLVPFFFDIPYGTVTLATTWMTAYADLSFGLLFGGCLCLYFTLRQARSGGLWQVLPILGALALIKENTMPIALVAAGVFAVDCLVFGTRPGGFLPAGGAAPRTKPLVRISWSAGFFAAVLGPFAAWKAYSLWANAQKNSFVTHKSVSGGLLQAVKEIVGIEEKSKLTRQVAEELPNLFMGRVPTGDGGWQGGLLKSSMAGSAFVTMLVILGLFALAILLAKTGRRRTRLGIAAGLLLAGYGAYQLELFVVYAFLGHSQNVFDYTRYNASYTAGWAMAGLLFLGLAAKWAGEKRGFWPRAAVLVLAVLMTARTAALVRPGYSVLDFPANTFDEQRAQQAETERFEAALLPGERVFFVSQNGDGGAYFMWHYYLYPTVVTYSITGGWPLQPPPQGEEDDDHSASLPKVRAYLADNDCDVILIQAIDESFAENYGVLFEALSFDTPALYRIQENGLYARVPVE